MVTIPLTRGLVAIVDDEFGYLAQFNWYAKKVAQTAYAIRRLPGPRHVHHRIYLHREVLGLGDSALRIDHRNGDGLDCRRENLRVANAAQNSANRSSVGRSGFKGVYDQPRLFPGNRWRARIRFEGRLVHLGGFSSPEAAASAYDAAARRIFGEFACVNFPVAGERGVRGDGRSLPSHLTHHAA